MKKTEMLKKNYEFNKVLKRGENYRGKYIDIFFLNNKLEKNLLGIAISKKSGTSVERNKIKRLIRENYRKYEEEIKVGKSIVILFKKNKEIKQVTYSDIKDDIENILNKSKLKKEEK